MKEFFVEYGTSILLLSYAVFAAAACMILAAEHKRWRAGKRRQPVITKIRDLEELTPESREHLDLTTRRLLALGVNPLAAAGLGGSMVTLGCYDLRDGKPVKPTTLDELADWKIAIDEFHGRS